MDCDRVPLLFMDVAVGLDVSVEEDILLELSLFVALVSKSVQLCEISNFFFLFAESKNASLFRLRVLDFCLLNSKCESVAIETRPTKNHNKLVKSHKST